jgi:predicted nucleic acid-binding Zn ribbon protein
MAKVSHSSDMTKCRNCGVALDVYVPPEEQFCSPECEAMFGDRPSDRDLQLGELADRHAKASQQ